MSGKRWKLEKETLAWINSLEFPVEHAESHRINHNSKQDMKSIKQHNESLIKNGLKLWIASHRTRIVRRLTLKAAKVSSILHISDFKVRQYLHRWQRFVQNSYLTVAALTYVQKKYTNRMKFQYKILSYFHYWRVFNIQRRNRKRQYLLYWKQRCNGQVLLAKFVQLHVKLLMRAGFLRWKRRSKWPLVFTKRSHWQYSRVLRAWLQLYHQHSAQCVASHTGDACYMNKHWPVWMHNIHVYKQQKRSVNMGIAVYSMRTVVTALAMWRSWQYSHARMYASTTTTVSTRRRSVLQTHLHAWQHYTTRGMERVIRMRQACRHYKYCSWQKLQRRLTVLHHAATIATTAVDKTSSGKKITTTNNNTIISSSSGSSSSIDLTIPSPIKQQQRRQKPRYLVFRGRLFHRKGALLRLLRHNIRSSLQQHTALRWGEKWWLKKVFRRFQFLCRKHRNTLLTYCYCSLTCKRQKLHKLLHVWYQKTTLSKQHYNMIMYNICKKYMKKIFLYKQKKEKNHYMKKRASIRFTIKQLRKYIQLWYNIIKKELKYKYLMNIYKKLHPILAVSSVKHLFQYWKIIYTKKQKNEKRKYRMIRKKSHYLLKKYYFQYYYEVYQSIVVRRVLLYRGLKKLYLVADHRKYQISQLNRLLTLSARKLKKYESYSDNRLLKMNLSYTNITTSSSSSIHHSKHSFILFLLQKGLKVHTICQFKSFRLLCRLRRYYSHWYIYSKSKQKYYKQCQYCYNQCIQQCSQYFATIYHIQYKHRYWQQWRVIHGWYQLLQRRHIYLTRRNTRILAKQYFLRWLEVYNRRVINYHLRIPSAPILSNTPPSRVLPLSITSTTSSSNNHHQLLTHRDNLSQHRDYSALIERTVYANTSQTLSHMHNISVDMAPAMPSFALDESINVLQLHPAVVRKHEQARLHTLSMSTIHPADTSTSNSYDASNSTSGHANTSRSRAVGKLIDRTSTSTPQSSSRTATGAVSTIRGHSRDISAVNRQKTASFSVPADTSTNSMRSRTAPSKLRPGRQPSDQLQPGRRLWGRTIEEDCIDAAKRSYTGQYLLSTDRLPIAL